MKCSQRSVTKNKIGIYFLPVRRLYSIHNHLKCDKCSLYIILISGLLFCTLFPTLQALNRSEFISTRPVKLHLTSPSCIGRCLVVRYVCVCIRCVHRLYGSSTATKTRGFDAIGRQIVYHRSTAVAGLTKSVLRCDRLSSPNIPWGSFVCIYHFQIMHRASSLYSMDSERNVWELY